MAQSMINNLSVFERAAITVVFVASWCTDRTMWDFHSSSLGIADWRSCSSSSSFFILAKEKKDNRTVSLLRIMFTMMDILWLHA